MHRLLKRQLRKLSLVDDKTPSRENWTAFLDAIDKTYGENDSDRYIMEQSLRVSSEEMRDLYQQQKQNYEDRLKVSEYRFRALFQGMPSGVAVFDAINGGEDFVFTDLNHAAEKIGHVSRREYLGKSVRQVMGAATASELIEILQEVWVTGRYMYRTTTLYGDTKKQDVWIESWIYKLSSGEIVAVYNDITKRKQSEQTITTLSKAVEQSPASVIVTSKAGDIEYVNSAFERVTGYLAEEVMGKNPRFLKSGKTAESRYRELWETLVNGESWQGEIQNRKKNGDIFWEHAIISPVFDDSGEVRHYLAVKEDVTLRKQQEEHILHQAHFDSLTDLPNRFLVLDRLQQLLVEAQRNQELVGVLFIDLDDFKKVNDTLGHETGDKLLIEASSRLRTVVRAGDTIGRLGGDEFIVLIGGLGSASDAGPVTEHLLDKFREVYTIDGRELLITASIGIAVYPNDGNTASELLRSADSAMYHSKDLGRNTYSYFDDAMNQEVSRRLLIEEQMHGAIGRGEFSVLYQPLVDLRTNQINKAEALLRWNNPALGEIKPEEFIPVAEQTGLIISIGHYVLTDALEKLANWRKGCDCSISVNLSPRQFRDPGLVHFIQNSLADAGIENHALELEITEGVLMSGHSYIDEVLDELNELGVRLAMDDFGTGYSSLSYLRSYPFDTLKIDKQFIEDITVDEGDKQLVIAAINMAHGLGLTVVAEGVEHESQRQILAEHNCDYVQGFLFSEAVGADAFKHLLDKVVIPDAPETVD